MSRAELIDAMSTADALIPTITDRIDAGIINAAGPNLKIIANFGSGVDHIDMAAAKAKDIYVTNTPSAVADDTADMVIALIIAATRKFAQGLTLTKSGDWPGWSPMANLGHRIGGRKLGIVGMGRIGQAVAKRAAAFGLDVHYHNRRRLRRETEADLAATYWENLDLMLADIDILSINCPLNSETHHLISSDRLALMHTGAVVVNTSRGDIVDQSALVRALENGTIAGAGLDVYENGSEISPGLLATENAVLLPHMGSATIEGRIEMGERVILNLKMFEDGHRPMDWVIPG